MTDDIHTAFDGAVISLTAWMASLTNDAAQWGFLALGAVYTVVRIRYYMVKTRQAKKEME